MTVATDHRHLRYLDATQVAHPSGTLAGVELCTANDETLGSIEGVLVEPACRRLRYFVVGRAAMLAKRRYLLPADHLAFFSGHDGRIHVEANAQDLERFDARSVSAFSADDAIAAIFAPSAA
jgi:hypothetical protein